MKISNLIINITDISDSLTLEQNQIVCSILNTAVDVVKADGVVTIQREYENSKPDILEVYKTEEQILNWKSNLNNAQKILNKPSIP